MLMNIGLPTPSKQRAKACTTQCTAGWLLGGTYDPTTHHCFRPIVIVKVTMFLPKLVAPSTSNYYSSLQTMTIPPWCRLSASVAHTL